MGGARSVGYGGTLIHTHTADDPGSEGSVAPLHVNEREHKRGGKEGGESSAALASRRCVDEIDRLGARAWAPSIPVTSPHSVRPRAEKTQWTLPGLRLLGTPMRYLHGDSRSIDCGAPGIEREIEILSTMCSRGGCTGRAGGFSGMYFWAVLQGRSRSLSGSRSKRRNPNRIRWTVDGGVGATAKPTELAGTWGRVRKTEMSQSGSSGPHLRSPQRRAASKTGRSRNSQGADGVIDV